MRLDCFRLREFFELYTTTPNRRLYVLEKNEKLIGFFAVSIMIYFFSSTRYMNLDILYLSDKHRNIGNFHRIMDFIKKIFCSTELDEMTFTITSGGRMRDFGRVLERSGFEFVGGNYRLERK